VSLKPTSPSQMVEATSDRSDSSPRLSVEGLVGGYGSVPVVKGMSLVAEPGTIVGLIGPNGSGKSTFVKGIIGIVKPLAGTVQLGERFLQGRRPDQNVAAGLGYLPQVADVFGNLTVSENLEIGGYLHRKVRPARKKHVLELLPILGGRLHQKAATLSGGERRLLGLGRVLMGFPTVILLDEPSAGLAPQAVKTILSYLTSLREEGISLVVVEQNVRAVLSIADRVYVMMEGQCAMEGTATEIAGDLVGLGRAFMGHARDFVGPDSARPTTPEFLLGEQSRESEIEKRGSMI